MNGSNLLELIHRLDEKDRKFIGQFVQSPFHNRRKAVTALYFYILQHIDQDRKQLQKTITFSHIFPEQKYDDQQMRYTMSFLLKTIEQFLIQQEIKSNSVNEKLLLLRAYRKRKLAKPFKQVRRAIQQKTQKSNIKDAPHYEQRYRLELEQYLFTEQQERNTPRNLQQLDEWMDIAFLSRKLRQACRQIAHQAVYKVQYDQTLLSGILPIVQTGRYDHIPAIALFFYYYQAFQKENSEYWFKRYRDDLIEHRLNFSLEDQKELFLLAINFTIRKFNQGEAFYLRETFKLYQLALELNLLIENDELSRFSFKNIASLGVRLGEFEWTEQFIANYASKLASRFRTNYVHYTSSKLQFAEGKYRLAMLGLQQVEYDDVFLNLDAKLMLLRIYFELNEIEVLDSFIKSFRRFLQRKVLMGYHKTNYLNILHFAQKIMELNHFDKKAQEQLISEIEAAEQLPEKDWLLSLIQ